MLLELTSKGLGKNMKYFNKTRNRNKLNHKQFTNAKNAIMNTDYIKTFLAVYRAGSFIDVAKEKNLAPSSVSRSINALENMLKIRLFQRTTRNLTPTQAGEDYFKRMAPLMEEMDLAHQSLLETTASPSGRLRVTASASFGQIVIAPKLKAFRTLYPNIYLELVLSDQRLDMINDQIDVAIRHGQLNDSSLIVKKLIDVRYYLVCSANYLEAHGTPRSPQDLEQHELMTFGYQDFRHSWTFVNHEHSHTIAIKPVLTVTNAATIRQCALNSVGIALLADWTVAEDIKTGKLVQLLPNWHVSGASYNTAIYLLYPSRNFIPAKVRVFSDFLINN